MEGGLVKEDQAQDEEDHQDPEGLVLVAGNLANKGNHKGPKHGGSLAEDVVDAKVLGGFFLGNEFGKIGPGQGLDGSLEHAYQGGQDPKVGQGLQEDGKDGDAGIGQDGNH